MGIVERMRAFSPQAFQEDWAGPLTADYFSGGPTASGVRVGGEAALRISTYFACVNVLAQDVGKIPLILYRTRPDGGRERAPEHPAYRVLHDRPNQFQTPYRFRQTGQAHLGHRGNTYAFIVRYRGELRELLPIVPDRVQVRQGKDYRVTYKVDGKDYPASEIFHVRGLSLDGFTGVSVATYMRETLGLAAATERHGARLFAQGALFRGLLKHPGRFKNKDVRDRIAEQFDRTHSGDGAHGTAVLEEGMDYEKISMTAEDSQFLQTREFQAAEIARWFRMPPHKVGIRKDEKYNSMEHASIEYVKDTLLSWLVSWEQEANASLLTDDERVEGYYFEHLVDGLLRGDQKARYESYRNAILTGWMSRAEARRFENMNPEPGLDSFLAPLNMGNVGDTPDPEDDR